MISLEKVIEYINSGNITDEMKLECLKYFRFDSTHARKHIIDFYQYYYYVFVTQGNKYPGEMHKICINYINGAQTTENLEYVYSIDLNYCYTRNEFGNCIVYVNKMNELKDRFPSFYLTASFYALGVLEKMNMFDETKPYVEVIEHYYKYDNVDLTTKTISLVNLLDLYAIKGDLDKFNILKRELDELLSKQESVPKDLNSIVKIHRIYNSVILKENISKEYIIETVDDIISELEIVGYCSDEFTMTLLPVFKKIKNNVSKEKMLDYLKKLIKNSPSIMETIELYKFAIETIGIEYEGNTDFYKSYSEALKEFYEFSIGNMKSDVEVDIEQYNMSKEYDYIKNIYHTDPLTGCHNRILLKDIENDILVKPTGVLYFDINLLKKVNDNYGHRLGDKFIKEFSSRLLNKFSEDICIRYGGDEFVVITNDSNKKMMADLECFIDECYSANVVGDVFIKFGCGVFYGKGITLKEAIDKADDAMYISKNNGLRYKLVE